MKAHCFKSVMKVGDEDGIGNGEVDLRVDLLQLADVDDGVLKPEGGSTLIPEGQICTALPSAPRWIDAYLKEMIEFQQLLWEEVCYEVLRLKAERAVSGAG